MFLVDVVIGATDKYRKEIMIPIGRKNLYLFACLFIYLFIRLFTYLFVYFVFSLVYLFVYLQVFKDHGGGNNLIPPLSSLKQGTDKLST